MQLLLYIGASDLLTESQCGWLEDKFGVSWQVVRKQLNEALSNKDPKKAQAAMQAMLKMKKIDIKALEEATEEK